VEPGECLLAIVGIRLAIETVLRLTMTGQFHSLHSVLDAITACMAVAPVLSLRLPTIWKIVFYTLVAVYGLPPANLCCEAWFRWPHTLGRLAEAIAEAQTLLAGSLILSAVWFDWRAGRRWSWLHWVGLAVVWWLPLVEWIERQLA
jgi:hypothetical protein